MNPPQSRAEIRDVTDIATARRRARAIAASLGFGAAEQARIVLAITLTAREALRRAGGGQVEFRLEEGSPRSLAIRVLVGPSTTPCSEPWSLDEVGRLMDASEVEPSADGGRVVSMTKPLPTGSPAEEPPDLAEELDRLGPVGLVNEVLLQDRELIRVFDNLGEREAELARLRRDLERAGRGIRALGLELDERANLLQQAAEAKTRVLL